MILTLVGSARFESWFHVWNEVLSLAGHCVFSLAVFPSLKGNKKEWYTPEEKMTLDRVHKDKILQSDGIVILNPFAYLGESTLSEIAFARNPLHPETHDPLHRKYAPKAIYALESWGRGCGITRGHHKAVRDAARRYNVVDYGSPIDTHTFYPLYNLLPSARQSILNKLARHDATACGYPLIDTGDGCLFTATGDPKTCVHSGLRVNAIDPTRRFCLSCGHERSWA